MKTDTVPRTYPKRSFRPWPENQLNFDFAEHQRFNVSELINEIIAKNFKKHVALKIRLNQLAVEKQFARGNVSKKLSSKSRR